MLHFITINNYTILLNYIISDNLHKKVLENLNNKICELTFCN